ncbi:MAG: hypothetical protein H5T33_06190 [Candidatus Methanosuratus sp.]|nr:hypothetical protein [Candidatus Methanosuratincola sp.]
MQKHKKISIVIIGIILLGIVVIPLMTPSTPAEARQTLIYDVDLCIPIEDSSLAEGLDSLGNVRYVGSLEGCEVLIIGNGYLSKPTDVIYDQLVNRIASDAGFLIVIDGAKGLRSAFLDTILKALDANGLRMPVMPIENAAADKTSYPIDPRLYTADIVAVSFKPYGFTVIESKDDVVNDIAFAVNNYLEDKEAYACSNSSIGSGIGISLAAYVLPTTMSEDPPDDTEYVGYIGWKSNTSYGMWGEPCGKEVVKVDYYYSNATTAAGTYKFFFAYVQHSAIGYGFLGIFLHPPRYFYSTTDWNTGTYSDQVLDDWGPTNSGENTVISYSVGAGSSLGSSVTITYSVEGGLVIKWWDQSDPEYGLAKTKHYITDSVIDVTYQVEPSSTGILDPRIDGSEPMTVNHVFEITSGFTSTISFGANLYHNDVDET